MLYSKKFPQFFKLIIQQKTRLIYALLILSVFSFSAFAQEITLSKEEQQQWFGRNYEASSIAYAINKWDTLNSVYVSFREGYENGQNAIVWLENYSYYNHLRVAGTISTEAPYSQEPNKHRGLAHMGTVDSDEDNLPELVGVLIPDKALPNPTADLWCLKRVNYGTVFGSIFALPITIKGPYAESIQNFLLMDLDKDGVKDDPVFVTVNAKGGTVMHAYRQIAPCDYIHAFSYALPHVLDIATAKFAPGPGDELLALLGTGSDSVVAAFVFNNAEVSNTAMLSLLNEPYDKLFTLENGTQAILVNTKAAASSSVWFELKENFVMQPVDINGNSYSSPTVQDVNLDGYDDVIFPQPEDILPGTYHDFNIYYGDGAGNFYKERYGICTGPGSSSEPYCGIVQRLKKLNIQKMNGKGAFAALAYYEYDGASFDFISTNVEINK